MSEFSTSAVCELSTEEHAVVERARAFAQDVVGPGAESWNDAGHVPESVYAQAGDAGLCALIVPKSEGGCGLGVSAMACVMRAFAAQCFATAFSFVVHNNLAACIARWASPSCRERYLPSLMSGHKVGAFLLTEPGTGSDAGAITTRAERTDRGWVINGAKAWISNGGIADTLSVYAQTDPSLGARGIACFAVDAGTPGVKRLDRYALHGGHALATAGFELTNCEVDDDALMVEPGSGFKVAMEGIDLARINVGAMCCGMLERSLGIALEYTARRHAFGQRVADFQGIQWMLADAATDLEAAQLLTWHAAAVCDDGEKATVQAAHAKKFATRVALQRIGDCMQVMGARGYSREHALPRHLEAAKMAQYLDGTTEIQNVVISRALLEHAQRGD